MPVVRKLRVAVFFTGDELAMPGEVLKPGAIYNSNRFTLRGLLENLGCEISDFGIVPDTLAATRDTLRRAAADNDLIITCLLYTSPSPRDQRGSRMPSSA